MKLFTPSTKNYRADIDGLRALAVLSVVAFHFNDYRVPNGFLGVDIFFVLSGYLITNVIYNEIKQDKFSFKDFYIRRIKRILPAFFTILIVGLALARLLFLPDDFSEVKESALSAILFSGNFFFAQLDGGYFSGEINQKPFLQLWSLAVEEQFYFVFPIILIGLTSFAQKCKWSVRSGSILILILLGLTIISTLSGLIHYTWDSYYLAHIRFSEMLIGAMLAIFLVEHPKSQISSTNNIILSIISLVAIIVSIFWGPYIKPYFPGVLALIPCLATAGLIYAGRNTGQWYNKLMSVTPIVWVGKISYSLYLWHWTLLAIFRYVADGRSFPIHTQIGLLVLIFICSTLSYYFIEEPLRHRKWSFSSAALSLYVSPSILILTFAFLCPTPNYKLDVAEIQQLSPTDIPYLPHSNTTAVGDSNKPLNVLIVGDSHALHSRPLLDSIAKHEGWHATISGIRSGIYIYDPGMDSLTLLNLVQKGVYGRRGPEEKIYLDRNQKLITDYKKYSTIIVTNFWGNMYYIKNPSMLSSIDQMLTTFTDAGKDVILLNTCYYYNAGFPHASLVQKGLGINPRYIKALFDRDPLTGANFVESKRVADSIQRHVEKKYPTVRWVDMAQYIPENLFHDGISVLSDWSHLSLHGAHYLAGEFIRRKQRLVSSPQTEETK